MITMNQTVGEDNAVIWFYKIYLSDGNILYLTDNTNGITIESITFEGSTLCDGDNVVGEDYDFTNGGSVGTVANINIEIPRTNSNTYISGFTNSLYPETSKPYIIGQIAEVGIGWDDITALSQITWMYEFYVEDCRFSYDRMYLSLYSFDIYDNDLPKHTIQKENGNSNFYFPNANDDMVGTPLPLLYGNYERIIDTYSDDFYNLAPTVCTNENEKQYYYASHKIKTDYMTEYSDKYLFRYLDNAKTSLWLYPSDQANGQYDNGQAGVYISLYSQYMPEGEVVYGTISLKEISPYKLNRYINYAIENATIDGTTVIVEITKHPFGTGQSVNINNVIGMTDLNNTWVITKIDENTFSVPLTTAQTYTSGGNANLMNITLDFNDYHLVKFVSELNSSELGILSKGANADIRFKFRASCYDGSETLSTAIGNPYDSSVMSDDWTITAIPPLFDEFDINVAQDTTMKPGSQLPHTLEEVLGWTIGFYNSAVGNFRLYVNGVTLIMDNILISYIPITAKSKTFNTRNNDGSKSPNRRRLV